MYSTSTRRLRFARDLEERGRSSIVREFCDYLIRNETSGPGLPIVCRFRRFFSTVTVGFCQPGCQCPQKTEIPPAVFTRFITYRVNAEWLPVLRKLVPLISLKHSLTDRIMAYHEVSLFVVNLRSSLHEPLYYLSNTHT